ncbi:MAG: SusD/RagB family nutrient-binding outer membrane lipoprotein [Gemmatimonadaceae bacterium]|nr:SusD/RagB family nutrient-binding outer membrane lipoprotein [Gemmatimonadaceae bacterium]
MKRTISAALLAGALILPAGCSDYLDVNTNPNAPEVVAANVYLPPMLHWLATSPQFDGRYSGHYTQEWISTSGTANGITGLTIQQSWGRHGYDPGNDNGAQQWRDVYWTFGQNLVDMNAKAQAEQRWDLLGVGLILKAWGWQALTDLHGEIIVKQAIDATRFSFDYDSQEYAYKEVKTLLDSAIVLLQRTDGAVDKNYLSKGDAIYAGDRVKWLRFAYGFRALHLNHYSNKAVYNPAAVIADVDQSFTGNADDALLQYPSTQPNDDRNFYGPTRANMPLYRQTQFSVNLMNGTQFGGIVDPRMSRMLSIDSARTTYIGLDPNVLGFGTIPAPQQPRNLWGYVGSGGAGQPSKYLFADKTKMPIMTYAQLQFIKAEAAYRSGNVSLAKTAYVNGISSHIDFVNARNLDDGQTPTQITSAEKAAFLASTPIVPATVTLSHIMSQKYIAQWGWGHNELWMDMRRYHYTDLDPVSGTQVFRGFAIPNTLYPDNAGKTAQRIRPRYNSEYVWNIPALSVIGGLKLDYHTVPMWITLP